MIVSFFLLAGLLGYFLYTMYVALRGLDPVRHWRAEFPAHYVLFRGYWLCKEVITYGSLFTPYAPPYHQYMFAANMIFGAVIAMTAATVRIYGSIICLVVLVIHGAMYL